tara:strand:- start:149 stop:520 length:372 start_codon:yes stop_codon:yes gene_type:complete
MLSAGTLTIGVFRVVQESLAVASWRALIQTIPAQDEKWVNARFARAMTSASAHLVTITTINPTPVMQMINALTTFAAMKTSVSVSDGPAITPQTAREQDATRNEGNVLPMEAEAARARGLSRR